MLRLVLIVGGAELALFVATRLVIGHWSAWEWQPELLRTAGRAGVTIVLWYFCRTIIFSGVPDNKGTRHPLFFAAVALLLAVPLLIGDWSFMGPFTKGVFAATSIVVAIHEEFLFRGIIQTLISRRWGTLKAIGITSAVMTVWHIGALPFTFFSFWQVFAISCMLGLMYAATRSMLLVVVLHALYDASWSATPVLAPPLAWHWGALLLMASLLLTWLWVRSAYQRSGVAKIFLQAPVSECSECRSSRGAGRGPTTSGRRTAEGGSRPAPRSPKAKGAAH